MFSVGDDYYEDVTVDDVKRIIAAFRRGEKPKHGPQNGRKAAEPKGEKTSLKEIPGPYCRDLNPPAAAPKQ
jgi:hypothetical protein